MSFRVGEHSPEITKLGNIMNCQNFSPKIQKFPGIPAWNFRSGGFPGIPFPNGNSRWPWSWRIFLTHTVG